MDLQPFVTPSALTVATDDQVRYASARIREYCRWHIAPSIDDTKIVGTHGGREFLLPTMHMTDVTSVAWSDADTSRPAIDLDDIQWSEIGLIRWRHCWPDGLRNVIVEFTHGYAVAPDAICEVAVSLAKRMPAQLRSVSQEQAGGVQVAYGGLLGGQAAVNAAWTAAERDVLDNYRIEAAP